MHTPARTLAITFGFVAACLLLGSGCVGRHAQEGPQASAQPKPQGAPNRSPVAAGTLVILTDQAGVLVGAISIPGPMPDEITIKKGDLIKPQDIDAVPVNKVFLTPGFQTITVFGMGDPCQYVVQGGRAVVKCW
jgi:hypothetical protein